ncbi:MjaI restriction endonuclease [Abditibacterium utsteinense]|uniref:MjaI restriction endonuclease n=1 Tax=Abditibacterium utsteinense TaxID=1960156 RepID=A0A2S8SWK1_9BACT|nr:MjaI family restriction endonuclease [Abditibacterium utsteinense]PQV65154.1 MjaI restriction endonuclease [Abditibacterium utsteinense]
MKTLNREVQVLLDNQPAEFPKYVTQILNLANQNAGGTRPKVVGQLSDLIQDFEGDSIGEWETYYRELYPDAIEVSTQKIAAMVENLKIAIDKIDQPMIEAWVNDLVFVKTFIGLKFQAAILKRVAQEMGEEIRLSTPQEETIGIDGFIGEKPISIKPATYQIKSALPESIGVDFIFYTKLKDGLRLEYDF